jgi:hypothetical protein
MTGWSLRWFGTWAITAMLKTCSEYRNDCHTSDVARVPQLTSGQWAREYRSSTRGRPKRAFICFTMILFVGKSGNSRPNQCIASLMSRPQTSMTRSIGDKPRV